MFVNITPTAWTNQPAYSQWGGGGPHDAIDCDTLGVIRTSGANNVGQDGIGSTTATTAGAFVTVTTDSAGNTLPPMAGFLMTMNPDNGENWFTAINSTVASGGKVYVAGDTKNGIRGNGTAGNATQTKFVLVPMPNSDTIVKMEGFQMILALSNHDSVLSWGNSNGTYGLGQGNSPVSNAPGYVHIGTGWHAYDIGSGGIFSWILADSVSGANTYYSIWSFGWQYDAGYQGIGTGIGTVHTTPQNVTNSPYMTKMTGHIHATKVTCNTETTYFICADGTLWDIGGNACGTINNGKEIDYATYSPPYEWNEAQNSYMQDTIYHVMPGITDFDTVYTGHSNSWGTSAHEISGPIWAWGRNKGTYLGPGAIDQNNGKSIIVIDANYTNGNIASTYPNSWDQVWADTVAWPNSAGYEISQASSPYCVGNPSGSPCNIYTIPTTSPPTISAGPNQNISTSSTTLAGVAHGQGGSIVNYSTWSQVSGPNTAIITAPGYQNTQVSGLITGTYTFKDSVTDNNWRTNTATMTVTVGPSSPQTNFFFAASGSGTACTSQFSGGTPCAPSYFNTIFPSALPGNSYYFNRGDVFPVELVVGVSGTAGNDITIGAYGTGPDPIIGGMTLLSGATNTSGNLWQFTWSAPTPQLLSINGVLASKGRSPNQTTGYYIPSAMGTNTITDAINASHAPIGDTIIGRSSGYTLDQVKVTGNASNILTVSPNFTYSGVGGLGWFVWNTPDSATEWNNLAGAIQVYSVGTPTGYKVPAVGIPLTISGNYITVNGLHLKGGDTTCLLLTGSHDNISSDSITFGYDGIEMTSTVADTISSNYIAHMGDNAILKTNTSNYNNVITNNFIYDIGMIPGMGRSGNTYQSYCGILAGDSGNIVKFNTLDSIGYIPIAIYGPRGIADTNYITNFAWDKVDAGGIYTFKASAGTLDSAIEIKSNTIVNGGGPMALNGTTLNNSALASAVYADNYSSQVHVSYNTAYNINGPAFFNHGPSNTFTHNTAFGSGYCDFFPAEVGPVITGLFAKYNVWASGSWTLPAVRASTVNNDLSTFGAIDSNKVAGYNGAPNPFWTFSSGASDPGTFRTPSGWTSLLGYDVNTTYTTGVLYFVYNPSGSSVAFSLPGNFIDLNGNIYWGSVTLAPYTSLVLVNVGVPLYIWKGSKIIVL
jgi:K319-like protein